MGELDVDPELDVGGDGDGDGDGGGDEVGEEWTYALAEWLLISTFMDFACQLHC